MNIFKFRILVDENDDFVREIEIKSNATFENLHNFIVKSLKLSSKELASFHTSNDKWEKLQEITLIDMSGDDDIDLKESDVVRTIFLMSESKLNRFLDEIDQKLIYEYDFLQMRTFLMELADITPEDKSVKYPRLTLSKGRLEMHENVKVEKDSEKLKNELLKEFNSIVNGDFDDDDNDMDDDY